MLDAVEESIDETEVDRRSLLALLHATSKPPGLVWNPVSNWQYPDVSEDVTKWDGVKCDLRKRYLTHDEKTGDLLEPLEVRVWGWVLIVEVFWGYIARTSFISK